MWNDVTFASFPTAEDSIVMKALSGRPVDWFDIQGIYDRGGAGIDHALILERLSSLEELIEADDLIPRLEAIRQRAHADDA